jgi:hypothetical protein
MPDLVYLTLHEHEDGSAVSAGVPLAEALALDREGFARLYRNAVYGAKRREALAWADRQIAEREVALRG